MNEKKDVIIEVPTATMRIKACNPHLEKERKFLKKSLKYIILTWLATAIIIIITSFCCPLMAAFIINTFGVFGMTTFALSGVLSMIVGVLLSIIPFWLGYRAITQYVIREIIT